MARKRSENAKAVAREVINRVRKGKKVVLGEIILEHGYSETVSKAPTKVTQTDSYKEEIDPIIDEMKRARDRIVRQMSVASLDKTKVGELSQAAKNLTHDIQLLSGGKTENNGIDEFAQRINDLINHVKANPTGDTSLQGDTA